jgi:Starch-binding associating with outer membrane
MLRKIITVTLLSGILVSCTKNFAKINQNPTSPATVPLDYLLAQGQLLYAGSAGDPGYFEWRANLYYSMPIMQQMASLGTTYVGDKYIWSDEASAAYFGTSGGEGNYPNSVKNLVNLMAQCRLDSATNTNTLAMARITKVVLMSIMTDLYGDVPYFNAGNAYLTGNLAPTFDPQSAIYPDLLNELKLGAAGLDSTKYIASGSDFSYNGNLMYWRQLAYSMMLRLGMRLQKVDPTDAQTWVTAAIAGGVFTSNAGTYLIQYGGGGATANINPHSYNLGPSDNVARNVVGGDVLQWSSTFIDTMVARQDPRLHEIASVGVVLSANKKSLTLGDTTAADQLGLPNGLNNAPNNGNIAIYSVMNPLTFTTTAPDIILSYAEVEFLKAEAEARGMLSGNAAADYALGQAAALQQMSSFNTAFVPAPAAVNNYLNARPYPASGLGAQVSAIQTELWLLWGCTYNGYEAWASYRRTGYPALTAINFPGNNTGGVIPSRLQYPVEEINLDPAGYQAAIGRMGPDALTTPVWWAGGKD